MFILSELHQFSSVQSSRSVMSDSLQPHESHAARQASLSITNSRSSLRLTSIESVLPSSHLILCHPLLLLPTIPPSIRVNFIWDINYIWILRFSYIYWVNSFIILVVVMILMILVITLMEKGTSKNCYFYYCYDVLLLLSLLLSLQCMAVTNLIYTLTQRQLCHI